MEEEEEEEVEGTIMEDVNIIEVRGAGEGEISLEARLVAGGCCVTLSWNRFSSALRLFFL